MPNMWGINPMWTYNGMSQKKEKWGGLAQPFVEAGVECYGSSLAGGTSSSQWEAAVMPGKVE
jgi:hypothetical protein